MKMRPICWLAVTVLLSNAPLLTSGEPKLPSATEVAAKIGENVAFEDDIKTISKSRTKEGCYLSFGAPYPQQVLSVWVPDDVWVQLPDIYKLKGRRVRITGALHQSSTGPMVDLKSWQQFELLPINEAILEKFVLDGRMDREHFNVAVRQYF